MNARSTTFRGARIASRTICRLGFGLGPARSLVAPALLPHPLRKLAAHVRADRAHVGPDLHCREACKDPVRPRRDVLEDAVGRNGVKRRRRPPRSRAAYRAKAAPRVPGPAPLRGGAFRRTPCVRHQGSAWPCCRPYAPGRRSPVRSQRPTPPSSAAFDPSQRGWQSCATPTRFSRAEGVDGSSPSEGLHEKPANGHFVLPVVARFRLVAGTRRVHFGTGGHSRARATSCDTVWDVLKTLDRNHLLEKL